MADAGQELSQGSEPGRPGEAWSLGFPSAALSLEIRMLLSSREVEGGHLSRESPRPASGELRESFLHLRLLRSLQLERVSEPRSHVGGGGSSY